jgi:hypothetical protein
MQAIEAATTPMQKHVARQEALAVKAELEGLVADANFKHAFKAAVPQNSAGMYKNLVQDLPVFMVRADGKKITGPVELPDGSKAAPNPSYQITVAAHLAPAMQARGYIRANSVFSDPGNPLRDPARTNNV